MIGAVGVDAEGRKHVLGIREGATENATVVMELLQDIVARGVDPKQKRLFIIDGSKSLRAAINAVFGADQPSSAAVRTSCATCSISFPRNRRSR
jgi:transposase-like protein